MFDWTQMTRGHWGAVIEGVDCAVVKRHSQWDVVIVGQEDTLAIPRQLTMHMAMLAAERYVLENVGKDPDTAVGVPLSLPQFQGEPTSEALQHHGLLTVLLILWQAAVVKNMSVSEMIQFAEAGESTEFTALMLSLLRTGQDRGDSIPAICEALEAMVA